MTTPILTVRDLVVEFELGGHVLRAVDRASLDLYPGQITGLVGESGSGKSTLAFAMLNLVPPPGVIRQGQVLFNGLDVLSLSGEELRRFRWKQVAVVFQAAQNALNPVMRVVDQMVETVRDHDSLSRQEVLQRTGELLELVRLEPERVLRAFPHELSGGMKQRVVIAMSLLLQPSVLILDEPTTALDVVTQNHILDILLDIREHLGLAMLLLTHDMAIVAKVADRVGVMYAGQVVEVGEVEEIFYHPRHPYTMGLLQAAPSLVGDLEDRRPIPGFPPDLRNPPPGCRFHPRCEYATERCRTDEPQLEVRGHRAVACHHWWRIQEEQRHASTAH